MGSLRLSRSAPQPFSRLALLCVVLGLSVEGLRGAGAQPTPCKSQAECSASEFCAVSSEPSAEGFPIPFGSCAPCHQCQCHRYSVDGACPTRCGVPAREVQELQGNFYSTGVAGSAGGGRCSYLWVFTGKTFKRYATSISAQPSAPFPDTAADEEAECSEEAAEWGFFELSAQRPPFTIDFNFHDETFIGYQTRRARLELKCPGQVELYWDGSVEPEQLFEAATSHTTLSTMPYHVNNSALQLVPQLPEKTVWDGKSMVYASSCNIRFTLELFKADAQLYRWTMHSFGCVRDDIELPSVRNAESNRGQRKLAAVSEQTMAAARDEVSSEADQRLRNTDPSSRPVWVKSDFMVTDADYSYINETDTANCRSQGQSCDSNARCDEFQMLDDTYTNVIAANDTLNQTVFITKYDCECVSGWQGSGVACSNVNECISNPALHNCHAEATCSDSIGSFTCSCNIGWNGTGTECVDIDECDKGIDNCFRHSTCRDTDGSFACDSCGVGWHTPNGKLSGVECESTSTVKFESWAATGSRLRIGVAWKITSPPHLKDIIVLSRDFSLDRQLYFIYASAEGTTLSEICETASSCIGESCILECHIEGTQTRPDWSITFDIESAGYGTYTASVLSATYGEIVAVANITLSPDTPNLGPLATDQGETSGGGLGGEGCNLAVIGSPCSVVIPIQGGGAFGPEEQTTPVFQIPTRCGDGRMSSPNETCDDGNVVDNDGCSSGCLLEADALCTTIFNDNMTYDANLDQWQVQGRPDTVCIKYVCGDGERNTAAEECDDDNTADLDGCSSACIVERGYTCTRVVVERLDTNSDGIIDDIREAESCTAFIERNLLEAERANCPSCHIAGGECVLWEHQSVCTCKGGYAKSWDTAGKVDNPILTVADIAAEPQTCIDIDECFGVGQTACSSNAICNNSIGSFECSCPQGYSGLGLSVFGTCQDINECLTGVAGCTLNAECTNSPPGSFTCACLDGYRGSGYTGEEPCSDYDECIEGSHDCGASQSCINTIGSFQCTCGQGLVVFGSECFASGWTDNNLELLTRMSVDGSNSFNEGVLRRWEHPYFEFLGEGGFLQWNFLQEDGSTSMHSGVFGLAEPSQTHRAFTCHECNGKVLRTDAEAGFVEVNTGLSGTDVACQWILDPFTAPTLHISWEYFDLQPDLESVSVCGADGSCKFTGPNNPGAPPDGRFEVPVDIRFTSPAIRDGTSIGSGGNNYNLKLRLVYAPSQNSLGTPIAPSWPNSNASCLNISLTNGAGMERGPPCGFNKEISSPFSTIGMKPIIPKSNELAGSWEGYCNPELTSDFIECQVFFNMIGDTFELELLGCEGVGVSSYATGFIEVQDEVPQKRSTNTGVFIDSHKRIQLEYTSGTPPNTVGTTTTGVIIWYQESEVPQSSITFNIYRPGQHNLGRWPGTFDGLDEAQFGCQLIYLTRTSPSVYSFPVPAPSDSTPFFAEVLSVEKYRICNDSITAMETSLETTGCRGQVGQLLADGKPLTSSSFVTECHSQCFPAFNLTLQTALDTCRSIWNEAITEGRSFETEKYLSARVLYLANTRMRIDVACTGNYRNVTCNAMPLALGEVSAVCPIVPNPMEAYVTEMGELQFLRFAANPVCSTSCQLAMESFFVNAHCCMGVISTAQQRYWDLMAPTGSTHTIDLNAYFCLYHPALCPVSQGQTLAGVEPNSVEMAPTPSVCGFQMESLECHFKTCDPAPWPSSCCYKLPCLNGWQEFYGSCYCRCHSAFTGLECATRNLHVASGLEIRETSRLTFEVESFRQALSLSLGVPLADCEMGYLEDITQRRSLWEIASSYLGAQSASTKAIDLTDTVNAGFRVLIGNERESLRMVENIDLALSTGAVGLTMTRFGYGNLIAFAEEPYAVSQGGDILCAGAACTAVDNSDVNNTDTDGTDTEGSGLNVGIIAGIGVGAAAGVATLIGCGVAVVSIFNPKLRARLWAATNAPKKISTSERKKQRLAFKMQTEEAKGMRFKFGMPRRPPPEATIDNEEESNSHSRSYFQGHDVGDALSSPARAAGGKTKDYSRFFDQSSPVARTSSAESLLGRTSPSPRHGEREETGAPMLSTLSVRQKNIRKQLDFLNRTVSAAQEQKEADNEARGVVTPAKDPLLSKPGSLKDLQMSLPPKARNFTLGTGLVFQDGRTMSGVEDGPSEKPQPSLMPSDGLLNGTIPQTEISGLRMMRSPSAESTLSPQMLRLASGAKPVGTGPVPGPASLKTRSWVPEEVTEQVAL